jgi:hypothetical protein
MELNIIMSWLVKFLGRKYKIIKVKSDLKTDEILVFGHRIYIKED